MNNITNIILFLLCLNIITSRRVKIAIYANVSPDDNPNSAFIYTNNVLYLNSLGADVVAVFAWDSEQYIDYVISNVDGFYFQGGDISINPSTMFFRTYKYILNTIRDLNDRNIKKVAMWHTCLGFEMFVNAINGSNALKNFDSENEVSDLIFNDEEIKKSKMYSEITDDIFKAMKENKIINENHKYGFSKNTFENDILKNFFTISSTSLDKSKQEYVASIESKNYPFFGVQYHPEKTVYQRRETDIVSHSFEAIKFTKLLGFNFIDSSRKSYENTIFGENLNESNYKTYCYLKFYNKVIIYDQKIFNLYYAMILGDINISTEFAKFSLRKIEINKFDYSKSEDGSTKIYYKK